MGAAPDPTPELVEALVEGVIEPVLDRPLVELAVRPCEAKGLVRKSWALSSCCRRRTSSAPRNRASSWEILAHLARDGRTGLAFTSLV